MSALIKSEQDKKAMLKSLNNQRNEYLTTLNTIGQTEEQNMATVMFLAQLDCQSVQQAADFACSELRSNLNKQDKSELI